MCEDTANNCGRMLQELSRRLRLGDQLVSHSFATLQSGGSHPGWHVVSGCQNGGEYPLAMTRSHCGAHLSNLADRIAFATLGTGYWRRACSLPSEWTNRRCRDTDRKSTRLNS